MALPITTGAPNGNTGIVPPSVNTGGTAAAPNGNTGIVPPSIPGSGLQPVDTNGDFHILPMPADWSEPTEGKYGKKGKHGKKAQLNLMNKMMDVLSKLVGMISSLMQSRPTTSTPTVNPTPRFLGPPAQAPAPTGQTSTRVGDGFTPADYNP